MALLGRMERTARAGHGGGTMNQTTKRYVTIGILGGAMLVALLAVAAVGRVFSPDPAATAADTAAPAPAEAGAYASGAGVPAEVAPGDSATATPVVVRVPYRPNPATEANALPFPCVVEGFWVCDEPTAAGTPSLPTRWGPGEDR